MDHVDPRTMETAGLTDVGRVRTVNQDSIGEFAVDDGTGKLLIVADGMGGHRGGEVASQLAVESAAAVFEGQEADPEVLARALQEANARIHKAGAEDRALAGMGTTGVALLFSGDGRAWVAHVGDSRAYRLSEGRIEQLTQDHSVVGELVRLGRITAEEARTHPQRNEILRAIGTQEQVKVEIKPVPAIAGDRFLLCSDGLSTLVSEEEIGAILAAGPAQTAARQLVDLANERGGNDNISVQVAVLPGKAEAKETTATLGGTLGPNGVPKARTPRWLWLLVAGLAVVGCWLILR